MVLTCRNREDTTPEHNRATQYPDADTKKNDPAWSGVSPMSARMVGMSGDMMMRMIKFRKKMAVRKNTGR
jgi:hypothetical protein